MGKIELSKWQNPEDGFPSDAYRDAVMAALEKAGIKVHDYWRDEPSGFNFELDRGSFNRRDFPPGTQDLIIGWRVGEESEPLNADPGDSWHGFEDVAMITGWHYVPCRADSTGPYARHLDHPQHPGSPLDALEEPEVVAAAMVAPVRPTQSADQDQEIADV